jgi:hypothetical protein
MRKTLVIDGEKFPVRDYTQVGDRIQAYTIKDSWKMVINTTQQIVFIQVHGKRISEWKFRKLFELDII